MGAISGYSALEIQQVVDDSPCPHARPRLDRRGRLYAQRCRSRDREYCSWCSRIARQSKVEKNNSVLSTIHFSQALWITLTSPPSMKWWQQAIWNSIIVILMTNLLQRVKREFGCVWSVYSVERSKNPRNCSVHVHLLLVRHDGWSISDRTTVKRLINTTRTYSLPGQTGSRMRFGYVKSVSHPKSSEHVMRISGYMLKDVDQSLSVTRTDRKMTKYVDDLRSIENHRLRPSKRRSHIGGRGFTGHRVHWSKNWGLHEYTPYVPAPEMPENDILSVIPESHVSTAHSEYRATIQPLLDAIAYLGAREPVPI